MTKKHWYIVLLSTIVILMIPILINVFINYTQNIIPVAEHNDWIGFFGNYVGAIIGGTIGALIAIYVARVQINQHKRNFEKDLDFKMKQQKDNFNNQLKLQKRQQIDEENRIIKENHKKQIYILCSIEMELIKIRNICERLQKQAKTFVFNSMNPRYDIISKERGTNHLIWEQIDRLVDEELKFELQLLREQYNEMLGIIGEIVWYTKDKIYLLEIEIEELKDKLYKSKIDKINLQGKQIKKEELEADLRYVNLEKQHFWIEIFKGNYIEHAERVRKSVRKEIIKSAEMNELDVPFDPNEI